MFGIRLRHAILAAVLGAMASICHGGSITVTTLADDYNSPVAGSLRAAINLANADTSQSWTITFNVTGGGTLALAANGQGARMLPILSNPLGISIDGANGGQGAIIIDGGSTSNTTGDRVFFIGVSQGESAAATGFGSLQATTNTNWSISNLTIRNGNARGGNGGGGGAGLGGGLFLNAGNLSLSGVSFLDNRAIGGNGLGDAVSGGGMGGGSDYFAGGAGGFGIGADGQDGAGVPGSFTGGAPGGSGGGGAGGANGGSSARTFNPHSAGGGGVGGENGVGNLGGDGGFGGGGGSTTGFAAIGGTGGYGGGGGYGYFGGNGGFGGGGSNALTTSGSGGFGGGNGLTINSFGGGGGLGAGAGVFVRQGASLTLVDGAFAGGIAVGGPGFAGQDGQGIGQGLFLAGAATYSVSNGKTITIADTIGGGIDAQITGGFTKNGAGTLHLSGGNSYTGGTVVNEGTLRINGAHSATNALNVNNNAVLGGNGSLAGPVNLAGSSRLAPGASVGALSVGSVSWNSGTFFDVEIDGTAGAGVAGGHDILNVTDAAVDLGGATLNVILNYTPGMGSSFTILNKQSAGAVNGTFAGLPEGTAFTAGGTEFTITYLGGDGNDIVLKLPEAPSLIVDTTADVVNSGDGVTSLREAITYANSLTGEQTIIIQPGLGTITLTSELPILTNPAGISINGNGNTVDGGSTSATSGYRVFFIGVGAGEAAVSPGVTATTATPWAISNLTIANGNARGGNGGSGGAGFSGGGGGGAGLGGALFVNAGDLILTNVNLINNKAVGGNAGASGGGVGAGGGGGLGGDGGNGFGFGAGGGGFGIGAIGGSVLGGGGNPGLYTGGAAAGNGASGGGNGGTAGGGGGAGTNPGAASQGGGGGGLGGASGSGGNGGNGGFGGGGGGIGNHISGGNGGYGGGGGGGGIGGFGGGGSGGKAAGFGGGSGGGYGTAGGGGLGAGGGIFIRQGASVHVVGGSISGSFVQGGVGANNGQGIGSGLFLAGSAIYTVSNGNTITISDTLGGGVNTLITGGFTKAGLGTLVLTGNNSFTGGTIVDGGVLAVDGNQDQNRLVANSQVRVNSGGEFQVRGVNALPVLGQSLDVTANAGGTLRVLSGGSDATGPGGLSHAHLRNLTLTGSSVVLDYAGSGVAYDTQSLKLNGDVTATGTSTIAFGSATAANGGIGLNGSRTFDVTSTADVLTVSAELQNDVDSAPGQLLKAGAGTLVLTGNNSYTGGNALNAGVLAINAEAALGASGSGVTFTSATLRTDAAMTLNRPMTIATGNVAFVDTNGNDVNISGQVSGNGGFIKRGAGALTLSNAANSQANNRIDAGVLAISDNAHLGFANGGLFMAGGTLRADASLSAPRAMIIQFGATAGVEVAATHTLDWSGDIFQDASPGALAKTGTGTLVLTGNNTYTGGTTVTSGTLQVGDGTLTGSLPGNVVDNATLAFNTPASGQTYAGVISGSGSFLKSGSGELTLTGQHTFSGGTTLNAGTLVLGDGTNPAALVGLNAAPGLNGAGGTAVSVQSGAELQVRVGATVTGGAGSAHNSAPGTGGVGVTASGMTTVTNAGTLVGGAGGSSNFISGSGGHGVTLSGGATLMNTGTITGGAGSNGGSGGYAVVVLDGRGTVINAGTISTGAGESVAIRFASGSGTRSFVNQRGGIVNGYVTGATAVALHIGSRINGRIGAQSSTTLTLTDDGTGGTQLLSAAADHIENTLSSVPFIKAGIGTWVFDQALPSHSGPTTVTAGTLVAAVSGALRISNVTVSSGATLQLDVADAIGSGASLILNPAMSPVPVVNLNYTGTCNIHQLSFDGGASFVPAGTWGGPGSGATYIDTTGRLIGNGILNVASGLVCDDASLCTFDAYDPSANVCTFTPVICDDSNACTKDTCDPVIGCRYTPINCDDNNACTIDSCDPTRGCINTPIVCPAPDQCHDAGTCDPSTGACSYPAKADGSPCDDGNSCTQTDTCQAGVCTSSETDSDGDAVPDVCDNCPAHPNPEQIDADSDGTGDACDGCPDDTTKTAPGACGCGIQDVDSDGDGTPDCLDECPNDSSQTTAATYYWDGDGDNYGNPAHSIQACAAPDGYVPDGTDCDDTLGAVYPGATESCDNGIDDDCDGQIDEGCIPPYIQTWESIRTHGSGTYALAMSASGFNTEPRRNGIQLLKATFDFSVTPVDGTLDAGDVSVTDSAGGIYAPTSIQLTNGGTTLEIRFAAGVLPDTKRYRFNLAGKFKSVSTGALLAGDTDCEIRSLVGDVNYDARVDSTDINQVKSMNRLAINAERARYDLNTDGLLNLGDVGVATQQNGKTVP